MKNPKNSEKPYKRAKGARAAPRPLTPALVALIAAVFLLGTPCPVTNTARIFAQESPSGSRSDRDSLVKDVVTVDQEVRDIDRRLAELDEESAALEEKIEEAEDEVSRRRERLAHRRRVLSERARSIYVNGRTSNLDMLLTSEDLGDFIRRSEFVKKVSTHDAKLIASVRQAAERLEESLSGLKTRKNEVDGVVSEFRRRKERLAEARRERRELLSRAGREKEAVEAESARVESRIAEVNNAEPPVVHTGRYLMMVATAYSPQEPGLDDRTATGMKAQRGVVAVDPRFIPLGTRLHVEGYGNAIAGDTGSAIKGNRIDLCFDTLAEVKAYGRRTVRVEILD